MKNSSPSIFLRKSAEVADNEVADNREIDIVADSPGINGGYDKSFDLIFSRKKKHKIQIVHR